MQHNDNQYLVLSLTAIAQRLVLGPVLIDVHI